MKYVICVLRKRSIKFIFADALFDGLFGAHSARKSPSVFLLAEMASALLNSHGYQDLLAPNIVLLCFNGAAYQGSIHIQWD
jgi:hypothetical protein